MNRTKVTCRKLGKCIKLSEMGSIANRDRAMKTVWRDLSARARLGECFGFLDALALFYKGGFISRELALEMLKARVSKDDLKEYVRVRQIERVPIP